MINSDWFSSEYILKYFSDVVFFVYFLWIPVKLKRIQLSLNNSNPHREHQFVRDEKSSSYGVYKALLTEGTRKLVRVKRRHSSCRGSS